jgi:hypothetical protein
MKDAAKQRKNKMMGSFRSSQGPFVQRSVSPWHPVIDGLFSRIWSASSLSLDYLRLWRK